MIEPKVQDSPKIVLDLKEPEIKIGPRKLFSDGNLDWANRPKFVKSYKQAQKEFWAQETLRDADQARISTWTRLGIFVNIEAQFVIFYKCCKIRKTQDIRPNIFYAL